ncbi:hypothetical protein D3C76_89280 [compost metagenome]
MDLNEFNTRVLNSIGIIDETGKGHLSRSIGGGQYSPFTIGGKRVVLPTSEHMRSDDSDSIIIFHPLSENITRSESDMIKSMRDQIMYRLTLVAVDLIDNLGRVAATDSLHAKLDKESAKFLKLLPGMDENTYKFLKKIIMRVGPEPEKRLVSISLRKGKNADGVLRSARFKFPVMEQLLTNDHEVLGVKYPSKKVRANLIALFEFVLGNEEQRAAYDYGSKNMTAPYFDALMMGFHGVATHLNDITRRHRKLLGKAVDHEGATLTHDLADDLLFDLTWEEGMSELAALRRTVPPQEGNEGAIIVAEPKEKEAVTERAASRLAPPARAAVESRKKEEVVDLPWEDSPRDTPARREEPARRQPESSGRQGKSLDDYLSGGRREESRDDRWGRNDRGRDDRWGRGGRDDRDGGRRYDLGLGREERDSGSRWSTQDFRREERSPSNRRAFGSGQRDTGRRF